MTLDQILRDCKAKMDKSIEHYEKELRGLRTGRATTALIDYVKVDYYGNPTDLKSLAAVSVPEPNQLLVKPFDPSSKNEIIKAIEKADLGLNPMAEDSKVALRNERRDALKHVDQLVKDKTAHLSEDQGKTAKTQIEDMTKKHIDQIEQMATKKSAEVVQV